MIIHPLAGMPAPPELLVNVPRLVAAYYTDEPDLTVAAERVVFGTSGHRGSSLRCSFNEAHVLGITQAICDYRKMCDFNGPLFLGYDTHALSIPAYFTAVEVLAGNGVELVLAEHDEYTPTPAISLAILNHNRGRATGLADGIVITPSHNPPEDGGFKYNPPNGGPAATEVTAWIEARANQILKYGYKGIRRIPYAKALRVATLHRYDFLNAYVQELVQVVDVDLIRDTNLSIGVDPLGGAGVHYWERMTERYGLNLSIVSTEVDPRFGFMTLDWDGRIRMDPSSSFAMQRLIHLKDRFDIAFACDTDYDRHGIVTPGKGLLPANHYLSTMIFYLFQHRPQWSASASIGKSAVTTALIDRIATQLHRTVYETPVGFKWFAEGLFDGSLGCACEESAGATCLRRDGSTWTTDKDGMIAALLAAEMTARLGIDPGQAYMNLTEDLGIPFAARVDSTATATQRARLSKLTASDVRFSKLAGEDIISISHQASGNHSALGGLKVLAKNGWFALRPSGTEDLYKIYAESFVDDAHLQRILQEAELIAKSALESQ